MKRQNVIVVIAPTAENIALLETNDIYRFTQGKSYLEETGKNYTVIYNN